MFCKQIIIEWINRPLSVALGYRYKRPCFDSLAQQKNRVAIFSPTSSQIVKMRNLDTNVS